MTEGDSLYEAKQGYGWDQLQWAMKDEVKAFQDNETCNLVRPPTDRDVIPVKGVYKVKFGPSVRINKNRARYVANACKKLEGIYHFETLRLPVFQRYLGFCFKYQRRRAM